MVLANEFALKTAGRLVKHGHHYWLLLAEGQLNGRRFGPMSGRIVTLPVPTDGGPVTKVSNGICLARGSGNEECGVPGNLGRLG